MKKSIMLSVQPQWLAKILNGDKTVEMRKTKPSCELPIDVYLYCTKNKDTLLHFVEKAVKLNGKVVARFTLSSVEALVHKRGFPEKLRTEAEYEEDLNEFIYYVKDRRGYRNFGNFIRTFAWHIDNLVIFDEPMALSEFYLDWDRMDTDSGGRCIGFHDIGINPLTKAPQSWQYVYVKEDGK